MKVSLLPKMFCHGNKTDFIVDEYYREKFKEHWKTNGSLGKFGVRASEIGD
jgi:hypothetical protein